MKASSLQITKRTLEEWQEHCKQVQRATQINSFEKPEEQKARKKRALKDYNYFVRTYFPHLTDCDCAPFQIKFANDVKKDKNAFGIAEWPREHAKSMHVTIFIPLWLKAHGELTGMVLMGKNNDDADNLLSDVQAELENNELYAHDWGAEYNFGSWEEGNFVTKSGIPFRAIGRDQSPRGFREAEKRPNYGAYDDVDDEVLVENEKRVDKVVKRIMSAMFFGLATKGGRLIGAGNRIGRYSVISKMVGDVKPGDPKRKGIIHSKVCAIENGKPAWDRYTLEELNQKIERAGIYAGTEYFHRVTKEGKVFKDKYFQWRKMRWVGYAALVGYFDPSFENKSTSDFKAVSVWGVPNANKEHKHCLKRFCRQSEIEEAFEFMGETNDELPAGVRILWYMEKQFFNRPFKKALARVNRERKKDGKLPIKVLVDTTKKANKFTRMMEMEPDYSDYNVFYNQKYKNTYDMEEGNNQVKGIEHSYSGNDDAPDADSEAWRKLELMVIGTNMKGGRSGRVTRQKKW